MKKILALVLGLMMVLAVFAGCAQQPAETPAEPSEPAPEAPATEPEAPAETPEEPVEEAPAIFLGLLSGSSGTSWRDIMINEATAVCDQYVAEGRIAGYKWAHNTNNGDATEQANLIRDFITDPDVNVIVVNPNSTDGLNGVIAEAIEAGKLVVSADATVSAEGVVNVTLDHYSWSLATAEYICAKLADGGNVVDVHGLDGHPADVLRVQATDDTLAKYPNIKLIARESGGWDQQTAKQVATQMLSSGQQIDGVFTQDGMAYGVLSAFLDAGKLPKVMFGDPGTAFYKEWAKLREEGADFDACVRPNPPGIFASGVKFAVRLAEGKTIKDGVLDNGTYYYQVGAFYTGENFDEVWAMLDGTADDFLLSEVISDADCDALFN